MECSPQYSRIANNAAATGESSDVVGGGMVPPDE